MAFLSYSDHDETFALSLQGTTCTQEMSRHLPVVLEPRCNWRGKPFQWTVRSNGIVTQHKRLSFRFKGKFRDAASSWDPQTFDLAFQIAPLKMSVDNHHKISPASVRVLVISLFNLEIDAGIQPKAAKWKGSHES